MCERLDSIKAQSDATDALLQACTTRCGDLLRNTLMAAPLPSSSDFNGLLHQIDVADEKLQRRNRRGKHNGHQRY